MEQPSILLISLWTASIHPKVEQDGKKKLDMDGNVLVLIKSGRKKDPDIEY